MLLRSLKLKNFRQYYGEQLIAFSCDEHQNVTVILGDNTSGKTTWCRHLIGLYMGLQHLLQKTFC